MERRQRFVKLELQWKPLRTKYGSHQNMSYTPSQMSVTPSKMTDTPSQVQQTGKGRQMDERAKFCKKTIRR